jgi:hypothetical protein
MNKLNIWRGTLTLFFALLITACGGGDDGGGGTPAAPIGDISGSWSTTDQVNATACEDGLYTENGTTQITQSGNSITATDSDGSLTGSISGNIASYSGSFPDDGGTVQVNATFTVAGDCNTYSGSANWTWSDGSSTCSGSTQLSGTRNDPVGCGGSSDDNTNIVSAPVSFSGKTYNHTIQTGTGLFASTGSFALDISATTNTYLIIGDGVNVANSAGSFTYVSSGTLGILSVIDSALSNATCNYSFSSSTSGTFQCSVTSDLESILAGTFVEA